MQTMNKEEYAVYKQKFLAKKKATFEAEPEVNKWLKIKTWIFRGLAILILVHDILSLFLYIWMDSDINYGITIAKTLFSIFWLFVFIAPQGSWRLNIMLFVSAFFNLTTIVTNYFDQLQGQLLPMIRRMPLLGVLFAMEILIPFLFAGTGCYLMIPKAHRQWSDRIQEINKNLQEVSKNMLENTGTEEDK